MTAVIGSFKRLEFRLPCVYKMMTTLPVTMGLMLLLSAVNWEQIDRSKSHAMISEFRYHTTLRKTTQRKNAEFQNNHR